MYLSRLILNPRCRAVRQDLADCQAMHRTVMSLFHAAQFEGDARAPLSVLHRVEVHPRSGSALLLVQSAEPPDWSHLDSDYLLDTAGQPENPACKPVGEQYGRLRAGAVLAFRLRANPTRKIETKSGPDGARRNGKRVELRGEDAQIDWLRRKGEQGGFVLLSVRAAPGLSGLRTMPEPEAPAARAMPESKAAGARDGTGRLTLASVLFDGELSVIDAERFRETLAHGVGSGKAYGFGLLSVAPAGR